MKKRNPIAPAGADGPTLAMKAVILGTTRVKDVKVFCRNVDTFEQIFRRLVNRYGREKAKELVDAAEATWEMIEPRESISIMPIPAGIKKMARIIDLARQEIQEISGLQANFVILDDIG